MTIRRTCVVSEHSWVSTDFNFVIQVCYLVLEDEILFVSLKKVRRNPSNSTTIGSVAILILAPTNSRVMFSEWFTNWDSISRVPVGPLSNDDFRRSVVRKLISLFITNRKKVWFNFRLRVWKEVNASSSWAKMHSQKCRILTKFPLIDL